MQNDPLFLCDNALGFYKWARGVSDSRLYFLAISIELSLKAYLRNVGWSDDDTRLQIGHNISKAANLANARGLRLPQMRQREILAVISQRYVRGGFRRCPEVSWPALWVEETTEFALELNRRVRSCLAG